MNIPILTDEQYRYLSFMQQQVAKSKYKQLNKETGEWYWPVPLPPLSLEEELSLCLYRLKDRSTREILNMLQHSDYPESQENKLIRMILATREHVPNKKESYEMRVKRKKEGIPRKRKEK